MTVATTPAQALDQFRAARSRWQAHLTARQDAETALSALLLAGKKQADYSERVPALRERIAVPVRACMRSGLCWKPARRTRSAPLCASTARR